MYIVKPYPEHWATCALHAYMLWVTAAKSSSSMWRLRHVSQVKVYALEVPTWPLLPQLTPNAH